MQGKLKGKPKCPSCDHILDGFTGIRHEYKPTPGDLTVCVYCSAMLEFKDGMNYKQLSDDEFSELPKQAQHELSDAKTMIETMRGMSINVLTDIRH